MPVTTGARIYDEPNLVPSCRILAKIPRLSQSCFFSKSRETELMQ
jgi:hypothetical protein